jgi:hypothetical protein
MKRIYLIMSLVGPIADPGIYGSSLWTYFNRQLIDPRTHKTTSPVLEPIHYPKEQKFPQIPGYTQEGFPPLSTQVTENILKIPQVQTPYAIGLLKALYDQKNRPYKEMISLGTVPVSPYWGTLGRFNAVPKYQDWDMPPLDLSGF